MAEGCGARPDLRDRWRRPSGHHQARAAERSAGRRRRWEEQVARGPRVREASGKETARRQVAAKGRWPPGARRSDPAPSVPCPGPRRRRARSTLARARPASSLIRIPGRVQELEDGGSRRRRASVSPATAAGRERPPACRGPAGRGLDQGALRLVHAQDPRQPARPRGGADTGHRIGRDPPLADRIAVEAPHRAEPRADRRGRQLASGEGAPATRGDRSVRRAPVRAARAQECPELEDVASVLDDRPAGRVASLEVGDGNDRRRRRTRLGSAPPVQARRGPSPRPTPHRTGRRAPPHLAPLARLADVPAVRVAVAAHERTIPLPLGGQRSLVALGTGLAHALQSARPRRRAAAGSGLGRWMYLQSGSG